ncbi:MAG: phosphate acyltransferase, partial [Rikenellaceae bacterium]
MELLKSIKEKACQQKMSIVLPEAEEERTLRAANTCIEEGLANIILIGSKEVIMKKAAEWVLPHIANATIIDPKNNPKRKQYVDLMVKLRQSKGLTAEQADLLIENPLYLGVLMIKNGDADGEVAGANNATGDVLRPALQYVKTKPGISVVSGAFLMLVQK